MQLFGFEVVLCKLYSCFNNISNQRKFEILVFVLYLICYLIVLKILRMFCSYSSRTQYTGSEYS